MAGGSKIKDDKQEYQYSYPTITPSGHEFTFYDTPGNERLVVRHTSGSHIEFKADGSIFMNAMTDVHIGKGRLSTASAAEKGSDQSTEKVGTDHTIEVTGKLNIKCSELNLEVGSKGAVYCGTDLEVKANNIIEKATEQISMEATKSIYTDTKEKKDSYVTQRQYIGTQEQGPGGGLNYINLKGQAVIQNEDPTGGITIAAAGYLNLICGQERLDLVGRYLPVGYTAEQRATWTQSVYTPIPPGPLNVSKPGGDYWFQSQSSGMHTYAMTMISPLAAGAGYMENVVLGNHMSTTLVGNRTNTTTAGNRAMVVGLNNVEAIGGNEIRTIQGVHQTFAKFIFLN